MRFSQIYSHLKIIMCACARTHTHPHTHTHTHTQMQTHTHTYVCMYINEYYMYCITQLCGSRNIGEFGEPTAIQQYFTYRYFPSDHLKVIMATQGAYFWLTSWQVTCFHMFLLYYLSWNISGLPQSKIATESKLPGVHGNWSTVAYSSSAIHFSLAMQG